jgi:mitochondrial fission protein ELM1
MRRVWVLADSAAGHANQALGVAEALGVPFETKTLSYSKLAVLPNALKGATLAGLDKASRAALADGPWPALVISAGRKTAPVARWIKRKSGGTTRLAQIMFPGSTGLGEFDLVAVPAHDRPHAAPNLMTVTGAPHRVTEAKLEEARARWAATFAHLPRPWVALLVGGSTRKRPFDAKLARELSSRMARLMEGTGGALLVTTSRRTPPEAEAALLETLAGPRWVYDWRQGGENPYFGLLALADAVVVTGDSMSMCCEASAPGGPAYIFAPLGWASAKHERLHRELYAKGLARPLEGKLALWRHPPLNAALEIAAFIRARGWVS